MNDMTERATATPVPSWQEWSVWLARTGYSDLEHSTVMTLQLINRSKIEDARQTPDRVYAAALEIEKTWDAVEQFELQQPLTLVCVDEEMV